MTTEQNHNNDSKQSNRLPSSFRDPSGFLFMDEGKIRRKVNLLYKNDYDLLMSSGLYELLVEKKWLIKHKELELSSNEDCHKIIEPEQLPYISYPYEWCFSQLKDAAILTLNILRESLKHGMILKDASAFNVQFFRGKAIFIDTLSFEKYTEGESWVAYKQYCQHFLAPLALIAKRDFRIIHFLRSYIDGIPLDLASNFLPIKSWFDYSILAHIHLHAKSQKKYNNLAQGNATPSNVEMSKLQLEGLTLSLLSATQKQQWKHASTEWGSYYECTNYEKESMKEKEEIVTRFLKTLDRAENALAADFGANTGRFSRLASNEGYFVVSYDVDEVAVDKNYRQSILDGETSVLPLLLDLTNPSPGLGWASEERNSFMNRCQVDVALALAIVHHLAISNNVPLNAIAKLFSRLCQALIIEFVPKSDSQVIRLLSTRKDIFVDYTQDGFENAFSQYFVIKESLSIIHSERTLFLMNLKP